MAKEIIKLVMDLDKFKGRVDEITAETSYDNVKHTIASIKKVLYENPDTPALCASQIGKELRLFVVRNARKENNRFKVFLNPLIVSGEGMHLSREKNLTFGDKQFIIPRRDKLHVAYQTEDGHVDSETFIGPYAEVVQQMIEMLDGITLADYGLDLDDLGGAEAFDSATEDERSEVLASYLSSLKTLNADLDKEIQEDEGLKFLNDNINFQTEVLKGNIKPVDKDGNIIDDDYIKARAHEIAVEKVKKMQEQAKEQK